MELVDLAGIQERVRVPVEGRPAVSITFDDGYAENCDFALPLLIQRGVPCTYFVTTENLRRQCPFPHDVAAGQALRKLGDAAEAGSMAPRLAGATVAGVGLFLALEMVEGPALAALGL